MDNNTKHTILQNVRNYYTYSDTAPKEKLFFLSDSTLGKKADCDFLSVKTNHLGNVHVVITDIKKPHYTASTLDFYQADVVSATDYYAFGSPMPGRHFDNAGYRFAFNGQEKDDEISGTGNSNTAEFWQYDTRLGRRWNVDPVVKPNESSYLSFGGNPIWNIDPKGDDWYRNNKTGKPEWFDTWSGEEREGYTYLGEHRYWNNITNRGQYEYFNFLSRGNEWYKFDRLFKPGTDFGYVKPKQGAKIAAGTVGVILTGGALLLEVGATSAVATGIAYFNLGTSVDDILTNQKGESAVEQLFKNSPRAKVTYTSVKLAAGLYGRSASLYEGLATKGEGSLLAFADFLKSYYDIIDGVYTLKQGFDEIKVMNDIGKTHEKRK